MNAEIKSLLLKDKTRFRAKGLFGKAGDSLSMRIPGTQEFLLALPDTDEISTVEFNAGSERVGSLHGLIYHNRPDAGSVLISETRWSGALATLGLPTPILFDEQARHLGRVNEPVKPGHQNDLLDALKGGENIAIYGEQQVCIGTTPERIVFNTELFEKCAKAFVIAQSSMIQIRKIPSWVCYIAGGRLRKDQKRAADCYASGRIPEGMNAY